MAEGGAQSQYCVYRLERKLGGKQKAETITKRLKASKYGPSGRWMLAREKRAKKARTAGLAAAARETA